MSSRKGHFKEFWVRHPLLDLGLVMVVVVLSTIFLPHAVSADGKEAISDFLMGLSALAGVAFAAETFACTMVYSSSNQFIQRVRDRYAALLRETWTIILGGTFLSAASALLMLFAVEIHWRAALVGAVSGVTLVLTGFIRSLYWLRYTLFTEHIAGTVVIEDAPSGLPTVPRDKI